MRAAGLWAAIAWAALLAASIGAVAARADGLPVLGIDVGGTGVAAQSGGARYVTLSAGRSTVLARVNPNGGRILRSTVLPGIYTIPAVAYDGSASGLSADGRTLVLIQPRLGFPRARTGLIVLNARLLRPQRTITLRGDFSFDAVSPQGRFLYLIQYTSAYDPTRYLVRAYDVRAGQLLAKPVVDPREPGDKMRGSPVTRATSPDGRWAYTLYDGAGTMPFVHALGTSTRTARCIDLDALAGTQLSQMHLRVDGPRGTLTVSRGSQPVVIVDTRTFTTSLPAGPAGSGFPWLLAALSTLGVLAGVALLLSLRRRLTSLVRWRANQARG